MFVCSLMKRKVEINFLSTFGSDPHLISTLNLFTPPFPSRITVIAAMILNQAWIGWNFIMFQMRRYRESCADASAALNRRIRNEKDKERKKEKKSKKREDEVHENGSPRMKSD